MTSIHAVEAQQAEWNRRAQPAGAGDAFRMKLDGGGFDSRASQGLSGLGAPASVDPTVLGAADGAGAAEAPDGLLDKAAGAIGDAFGFLKEVGVTITETIVLKWNSAGQYEVYANRSCSATACYEGQLESHPDGDLLEGILNGGLPGFEDLTSQIRDFFAEADAMVEQFIGQANGMREASGLPDLPFQSALDFWKSLPNGLEIPLDQLTGGGEEKQQAA